MSLNSSKGRTINAKINLIYWLAGTMNRPIDTEINAIVDTGIIQVSKETNPISSVLV